MTSSPNFSGRVWLLAIAMASLGAVGCNATVGAKGVNIPEDSAQQCESHCRSIGLELSAVAIMANNVGCVCQPAGASRQNSAVGEEASATAGGMTAIVMQEQARQQQQARTY